jgi:hypothetical protein
VRAKSIRERRRVISGAIGDPRKLASELAAFRKTAQRFSSDTPRLIDKYPKQWVAIFEGEVVAHAPTFEKAIADIEEKGIPRQHVMVRYIDRFRRTFIL